MLLDLWVLQDLRERLVRRVPREFRECLEWPENWESQAPLVRQVPRGRLARRVCLGLWE